MVLVGETIEHNNPNGYRWDEQAYEPTDPAKQAGSDVKVGLKDRYSALNVSDLAVNAFNALLGLCVCVTSARGEAIKLTGEEVFEHCYL